MVILLEQIWLRRMLQQSNMLNLHVLVLSLDLAWQESNSLVISRENMEHNKTGLRLIFPLVEVLLHRHKAGVPRRSEHTLCAVSDNSKRIPIWVLLLCNHACLAPIITNQFYARQSCKSSGLPLIKEKRGTMSRWVPINRFAT